MKPTNERWAGLSLEYKLPLLIIALLVATLSVGTMFAFLEVRNAAVENVRTRLELLARDLANIIEPTVPRRLELLRGVAADPTVLAYATDPTSETEPLVREALDRLHLNNQVDMRIYLMDAHRVPQVSFYPHQDPAEPGLPTEWIPDEGFGSLFEFNDGVYFWTSVPVLAGSDSVGFVAELRRVGGTDANPFEALIGHDVQVYFGNTTNEGVWVTLDGEALQPPTTPFYGAFEYEGPNRTSYLAYSEPISGIGWKVVAQAPMASALARPYTFLRHAGLTTLLVCLLGMAGAWLLSRSITRPLREMRFASEAIARGDYDRRIDLQRSDELGILANAYNDMAEQVRTSHEQLTDQYLTAQELASELDRASQAKSEFLAIMSHEIRTPINAIVGYTDLLLLGIDGPVTVEQAGRLERIRLSGQHLVSLVDQVLDVARFESGRLEVETGPDPAARSVQTMLALLGMQAEEKGIQIVNECSGIDDFWFESDPHAIDQILLNLLSNAIKFTDPGGTVIVRCDRRSGRLPNDGLDGEWTLITIEDSGPGIPRDHLEAIFEPFVQVDSGYTRKHGGAGLGLAISRKLTRSMGGELTVTSVVGEGSSFTVWLRAAKPGAEVHQSSSMVAGTGGGGTKR